MQTLIQVEPDWKMMDQYVSGDLHSAFGFDGLETSRPMNYPASTNAEISDLFDGINRCRNFHMPKQGHCPLFLLLGIAYEKSGCVIRMMSNFLGEETFRKGLIRYLNNK